MKNLKKRRMLMSTVNNKTYSDKQEKLVAKTICGKQISGSGARPFAPGDVENDEWLFECKTHTTPGHKIVFNSDVWKKIKDEAMIRHKYPAYVCDDGSQLLENQLVLFSNCPNDFHQFEKLIKIEGNIDKTIRFSIDKFERDAIHYCVWHGLATYVVSLKYFEQLFK